MKNILLYTLINLSILSVFSCAYAGERIKSFDVEVEIQKDSSFFVTEKITYDFSGNSKRGIYRDIPLYYKRNVKTKWGKVKTNFGIRLNIISVLDSNGRSLSYKIFNNRDGVRIRIGSPTVFLSGVKEYYIKYKVRRAINRFTSVDEFYWNVTGHYWSVPIKSASIKVVWPYDVRPVKSVNYIGYLGSKKSLNENVNKNDTSYSLTTRNLYPREGLTVGLSFPKGALKEPSLVQRLLWFITDNLGYFLLFPVPLLVLIVYYFKHKKKGKDPYHPDTIQVRYDPPDGLNPAEVGTLQDEVVHTSDIVATVLDLASRGYLKIKETKTVGFLFLSEKNYKFIKRKSLTAENDLSDFEFEFLNALFFTKDEVLLSDLKDKFYVHLNGLTSELYKSLTTKKLFDGNPNSVRAAYTIKSFLAVGLINLIVFVPLFITVRSDLTLTFVFSLILSAVIAYFYSQKMPRKTKKGVKLLYQTFGFKEFVSRVEKSRLKMLLDQDPEMFGRMLPYALVLGCADEWAEKFEGLITKPLSWYDGYDDHNQMTHFSSRDFVHSMGEGINTMSNTFKSSPQPQGGSGSGGGFSSGGGGFSGGGFGGGGGGSW